ncbi:hypothetical protein H5202_19350 [Shewanella sp. SG41-4]|uniref:hypothetical protein n=1 Tax=Shewanella sp. SG41-4 TaxID=2760976 RepID=UPI001603EDB6|nr:hypothetical protein [Shewanella sp. SG41-4]MBB1440776.1 hypothetical protein [Shewanella sp. SG41-4]
MQKNNKNEGYGKCSVNEITPLAQFFVKKSGGSENAIGIFWGVNVYINLRRVDISMPYYTRWV